MRDFDTATIRDDRRRLKIAAPEIFGADGHHFTLNAPLVEASLAEPFAFREPWNDLTGRPGDALADRDQKEYERRSGKRVVRRPRGLRRYRTDTDA